jgi:hypothetical protein
LQEPFQLCQDGREAFYNLCAPAAIVKQRVERGAVLLAKLGDESGHEIALPGLGTPGGVNQAIGDAAHGRDNDGDRTFRRGGLDDRGGTPNAIGVSHRGTAELHHSQRGTHRAYHLPMDRSAPRCRGEIEEASSGPTLSGCRSETKPCALRFQS